MSDQNLTEAEKKFLAFDWSKSNEWLTYFSNLYPTPDSSKVAKFKRTWFRRNVDPTLSESSTVGDPVSTKKEPSPTSSTSSSSKFSHAYPSGKWPATGFFEKFQNRDRLPLLKELTLRVELVLLLGFLFSTLVVMSSKFRTPGSENLVKNCVLLAKTSFMLYLLCSLLRERGLPKWKVEWFNSLVSDSNVHYMSYGMCFMFVPPRLFYYVPQLLTALLSLNGLYKAYPSVFPRLLQTQKAKDLLSKFDQNQYQVYKLRSFAELAMVPYLVLTSFLVRNGMGSMVPLFLYTSFVRLKVSSKDTYFLNALKTVHMGVLNYLNHPKVPHSVRTGYQKVVKALELYFTGRRG